jgi:DNA-binding NarL/FixJ family response regulator
MCEQLSILTVATPVPTVLDLSVGHNTITSSLGAVVAAKPRKRGVALNHLFPISPPASVVADLSMRERNDLNCGTWDCEIQPATRLSRSGWNAGKGGDLETSSSRVLVVEDSEPFRKFICSALGKRPDLQIVGEVTDGLEAVQQVEELQPDLIVLDIGLPSLNGIEVARRVRKLSPQSRILFLSQETSTDIVQEALSTGAHGYIVKPDAGRELPEAVTAVLRGEQFVGRRFSGHALVGASDAGASHEFRIKTAFAPLQQNTAIAHRHDVGFYSDDAPLLNDLTQFIAAALNGGNAAIVVATESHRESLLLRLQAHGLDIGTAIEQGRYIPLDAADTLSALMLNGMPDPGRFLNLLGNLIVTVSKAVTGKQARVAIFGECVQLLWAKGNGEAAIQFEKLGNRLAKTYDVDILCGYSLGSFRGRASSQIFQRICAEHSAAHSR